MFPVRVRSRAAAGPRPVRAGRPALLVWLHLALALAFAPGTALARDGGQALQLGTVEFRSCEIGAPRASGVPTQAAFCANFPVPENWDEPAGRHIGLRIALVRSLAAQPESDLVVFLDGGPGGAATDDYPTIAAAMAPLRRRHHILLMDQRGTGGSNALSCGEELSLETDPAPPRAVAGGIDRAAQLARIRACVLRLTPKAAPQYYATTDAVRDLEALRAALGGVALDLVGISYGTRLAQQYAARYPQAVRAIVLDSAVPNRLALLSEHAANLEDVVRRRLARCREDPACTGRFGDPYASLQAVQQRLRSHPQSVEVRDPQSFALERRTLGPDELAALIRFYLYSAPASALLPFVIDEARQGRYAPLLEQSQLVVDEVSRNLSGGMAASVLCTEDADLLADPASDDGTLLGGGPVRTARLACAAWPHRDRPSDFHKPFVVQIPVLVLAGEFDPVTPPRYGAEIAAALPRARVLLAPGQGHAVLGAGCMPRLVGEFVQRLDLQGLDARCLQALGESPPFLDANGPAP